MNTRTDIKKMISPDAKIALDYLVTVVNAANDKDMENALIVIKTELETVSRNNLLGTIQADEFQTKLNQININILKIIDYLPDNYLNLSNTPSAAAIVSNTKSTDDSDSQKNRLIVSGLLRELLDFEVLWARDQADPTIVNNYNLSSWYNTKRQTLVNQIIWFLESTHTTVSTSEYVNIARGLVSVFDDNKAEQYFKRAISTIDVYTDSVTSKLSGVRSYANFLYTKGRADEGSKQYDSAIMQGEDSTTYALNGYTRHMQFSSEWEVQNIPAANAAADAAKGYYNKITFIGTRNYWLNLLNTMINSKKSATTNAPAK